MNFFSDIGLNSKLSKHILLVDDMVENLHVMVDYIEKSKLPYILYQSNRAKLAFEIACNRKLDLIITDWEMPEIDGIELLSMLKANPDTADIPVIICTGVMTSSGNLSAALNSGAIDYIRKPIDGIELLARIQAALRLSDSYKTIKQLNQRKNLTYSIIAHDLRNPIGNLKVLAELLSDELKGKDIGQGTLFLDVIKKQSESIFSILENLLYWEQSQRENKSLIRTTVNIDEVIQGNLSLMAGLAQEKELNLKYESKPTLTLEADKAMLSAAIRNLIANAIKFTNNGGYVQIAIKQNKADTQITVSDNGIGIKPEEIPFLFDEAYKLVNDEVVKGKGGGLGLKLCKIITELHGGSIHVESDSLGTRFTLKIPAL